MNRAKLIRIIHNRTAEAAIGPSTLRRQGAKGVIQIARDHMHKMNLRKFATSDNNAFKRRLKRETKKLMAEMPRKARSFGGARKVLNLFLRDCVYCHYLRREYGLSKVEKLLEIPLDSVVAKGLKQLGSRGELPTWKGLKGLEPGDSARFQEFALAVATRKRIARVHLDAWLWVEGR